MESKSSSKVRSTILFGSLIVMLIGAIFQVQHYPYGKLLFFIGVGTYIIASLFEIDRLQKIIAKYVNDKSKTN